MLVGRQEVDATAGIASSLSCTPSRVDTHNRLERKHVVVPLSTRSRAFSLPGPGLEASDQTRCWPGSSSRKRRFNMPVSRQHTAGSITADSITADNRQQTADSTHVRSQSADRRQHHSITASQQTTDGRQQQQHPRTKSVSDASCPRRRHAATAL